MNSRRRACLILLITIWSAATLAIDRPDLKGYDGFLFGTAESVIRKKIKVGSEETDSLLNYGALLLLDEKESVNVGGIAFVRRFAFQEGKLVVIQLLNDKSDSVAACDSSFDHLYGMIKAQYGEPDIGVKRAPFFLNKITTVRFTFRNSAALNLGAVWSGMGAAETCKIIVTYEAPKAGASF